MESMGYELPEQVVTSTELEERIAPVYNQLRIPRGQLQALTGIRERRWWPEGHTLSDGAAAAGRKALAESNLDADDVEVLLYCGVCRENFEPATACAVAQKMSLSPDTIVYDISNACLGVMNGIIDVANRIELKQIRAGMVVSCETSREINEITIARLQEDPRMEVFTSSLATLTGGSGAIAVLLTDGSFQRSDTHRLMGAANKNASEHHALCRWGVNFSPAAMGKLVLSPQKLREAVTEMMRPETIPGIVRDLMTNTADHLPVTVANLLPAERLPRMLEQFMSTDSVGVLKHGVDLGLRTWESFLGTLGWAKDQVDKVICHQVGSVHQQTVLRTLGIDANKDFATFTHLGNIGTVSLPITAAMAKERGHLCSGDRVSFLGIGSGLNCLMLGWDW